MTLQQFKDNTKDWPDDLELNFEIIEKIKVNIQDIYIVNGTEYSKPYIGLSGKD